MFNTIHFILAAFKPGYGKLTLDGLFGLSEGYFLRFQDHIATTLAKRKIEGILARIVPLSEVPQAS
jgi:hypothetical protein